MNILLLLLTCAFCGQGIHSPCLLQLLKVAPEHQDSFGPKEVQKKINPCSLPGFFYICHCCEKEKVPSDDDGKKKSHPNRNGNLNHTNVIRDAAHSIRSDSGAATEDSVTDASEDVSQENENSNEAEEFIHRERLATEQQGPTNGQHLQQQSSASNSRIHPNVQRDRSDGVVRRTVEADRLRVCSFYRKGTCRFGISGRGCSRSHPKPCRKFMQHGNKSPRGCSAGSNCLRFHPQICSSSLSRGECLNEKCTSPHIKGTRRSNTLEKRSPHRRQLDRRPETGDTAMGVDATYHREDFLSALAVLKMELMDSFEKKLQTLQTQIQQVGTADATQFYPQTYRYPQRVIPHQTRQIPMY